MPEEKIKIDDDIFGSLPEQGMQEETDTSSDEDEEFPRNRQERRLKDRYEQERQASIEMNQRLQEMNARLESVAEAQRTAKSNAEYLEKVERIWGTETPEGVAATELLKAALNDAVKEARESALSEFRTLREQEKAEEQQALSQVDSMIESVEDAFEIDLSSTKGASARRGFLKMMERVSPKDANGNIVAYADPIATWEMYEQSRTRTANPAKDIAARARTESVAQNSDNDQLAQELSRLGYI